MEQTCSDWTRSHLISRTRSCVSFWLIAAAASAGVSASADGPTVSLKSDNIATKIEKVLATPGFQQGQWGVLVVDAKTGQTIYERNADRMFAPASVTKIFSASAALVELGPDWRFQTPLIRRGKVDAKGTLHGDLILLAQGDLAMGGRTGADGRLLFKDDDHTYSGGNFRSDIVTSDPLAGLDHLAREAFAGGIREIDGEVVVDDRLFVPAESTGSGPHQITPIVINDNLIDILVQPAQKVGDAAVVTFQPATQFVSMDAQVDTVDADQTPILEVRGVGHCRFEVRGKLPIGHARVVKAYEVEEPAAFARALLIEALRRRSVKVGASPLGPNPIAGFPPRDEIAGLPKVAEYTSPPFSEYLKVILKVSHNLHASTLPLLLAARHNEHTLSEGLRRQGKILASLGVHPGTVSFGGGAGGDRADLVTPRAAVTLLRTMAGRPDFAAFDTALPILGRDGTLAKSVASDSPARGHAHAKTGTYTAYNALEGKSVLTSKALAGYLETASGQSVVFSVFVNNVPLDAPTPKKSVSDATAEAGRLLGKLCEVLYAGASESPASSTHSDAASRTSANGAQ